MDFRASAQQMRCRPQQQSNAVKLAAARQTPAQCGLRTPRLAISSPYRHVSCNVLAAPPPAPSAPDQDVPVLAQDQPHLLASTNLVCFSAAQYVKDFLDKPLHSVFPKALFVEAPLDKNTAQLAQGADVAVIFVNDNCSAEVVEVLAQAGVKLIALRCAGYDRVDLAACQKFGLRVVRVPTYSPQSVAEHAVALMFALNRNIHCAYQRVTHGNYSLSGLVGFEMNKKVVGVVGTGAIGVEACRILKGIGCEVLAVDMRPNPKVVAMGIQYLPLEEALPKCDIVTLHCPLMESTFHLINKQKIDLLKPGAMLINVSRGGLVDSDALFDALETGHIGSLGLDVYENEGSLFFVDHTMFENNQRMKNWDRRFKTLLSYPQVLVTPHSAFLTHEALHNIASTTIENITAWRLGQPLVNEAKV